VFQILFPTRTIFSRFFLIGYLFFPRWNLISGLFKFEINADVWGPTVSVSVAGCRAPTGRRGRHPPAACGGIKFPGQPAAFGQCCLSEAPGESSPSPRLPTPPDAHHFTLPRRSTLADVESSFSYRCSPSSITTPRAPPRSRP
jgi:hypothetical protein